MNKKITYEDAAFIFCYKKKHFAEKYLCTWTATLDNNVSGWMKLHYKWWVYILLFIPISLATFIYCLYDGGIRDFEFPKRCCDFQYFMGAPDEGVETVFGRFKLVYNKAA